MFTGVAADEKTQVVFRHPQRAARSIEFAQGTEILSISFASDDLLRKLSLDILHELTGNQYAMCDDCSHVLPLTEMTELADGSRVCPACEERASQKYHDAMEMGCVF